MAPSLEDKLDDTEFNDSEFINRTALVKLLLVPPTARLAFRMALAATSPAKILPLPLAMKNPPLYGSIPGRRCSSSNDTVPPTRLDALPLELLDLTLANINKLDDVFAVSYALPRLWPI
jgi:hypothetical protein